MSTFTKDEMSTTKSKGIKFYGIYLSKNTEAKLKNWCKLTQQNYVTINKRFNRIMAKCPYSKESRVAYYRQYAFLMAINLKQPFDELVLYSSEDFLERIHWVLKGVSSVDLSHKKLIKEKKNKVNYQLAKGLSLSEILEELFYDYDLSLTEEQLSNFKSEFTRYEKDYKTLNSLALEHGLSPKLVNNRIYKKKWGLDKALTTVSY